MKSVLFILAVVFSVMFVVNDNSFAVSNSNNVDETITGTVAVTFCDNIATKGTQLLSKFDNLSLKLTQAWDKRDQAFLTKWQGVDKNVADNRSQANTKRFEDYSKLEQKAETTAQTQAVRAYEDSVNAAIDKRRKSYDEARLTFRNGVKSATEDRRNIVNGELNSYKNSIIESVEAAKASCVNLKKSKVTTRQTFRDDLKQAQSIFKAARSSDAKVKDRIQPLIDARKLSFEVANQAFQSSLATARATLNTAFSQDK